MAYFAHALYGIVPEVKVQKALIRCWSKQLKNFEKGRSTEWLVGELNSVEKVKTIIAKLGFPDNAIVSRVPSLNDPHFVDDGSPLYPGTFVVGWGVLMFPGICDDPVVRKFFADNQGKLDWHSWVVNS
jgi:hypothetical protein